MFRVSTTMHKYVYASVLLLCVGCSIDTGDPRVLSNAGAAGSGNRGGNGVGGIGGIAGAGGSAGSIVGTNPTDGGATDAATIVTTLPPGFTQTEVGGYQLGTPLADGAGVDAGATGNSNGACGNIILGVVRDFKGREQGGHPDFEGPLYGMEITPNLVAAALGVDQKPVYASMCEEGHPSPAPTCPFGPETTTKPNFDQWYRYTVNVNQPFLVNLWFAPQSNGLFTFQSLFFYPLDLAGFGNSGTGKEGRPHNFSFTTELHTRFQYKGGETFQFEGDDDVWVFINNHLAVDVGGLHPKKIGAVTLDTSAQQLGIVKGNVYNLDLFHAERHTPESTFRIDTNLSFVNCGTVPPDVPR